MGAFFVVNEPDPERALALRTALDASMQAQGFSDPERFGVGAVQAAVYGKLSANPAAVRPQVHHAADGRVAALTGTAVVGGDAGADAARNALGRLHAGEPDWSTWLGQFCALIQHGDGLDLFLDPLGIYKVYRRDDGRVFSSSFLAVAATLAHPRANPQGVYEYLAQEATYANDTVLCGVTLAQAPGRYRLDGGERFEPWPGHAPEAVCEASMQEHVQANLSRLRSMFRDLEAAFGPAMDTALSGGYDSRLLLALLQERDVRAQVHVYGAADSADVVVARRIAEAEGFALHHEDKALAAPVEATGFAAVVARNFTAFDGYPCAGIFDGGVDLATRRERAAGARLMLNGGGGEVFRNFFYLPDRPLTVRQLLYSFYSRYDPALYTERFHESRYLEALESKILGCLGATHPRLSRVQVERVYPEFRCRFWMGRNNAVNNRLGFAITPFVDPLLLPLALAVPLRYKNHGRLEAAMISAVSPSLARHGSDYGHPFDAPPPLSRRLRDWSTMLRPPWLRRYTFRLRNHRPQPRGRYLQPQYLREVIDPSLPLLGHFIHPQRCNDPGTFQRACTLEYLFQRVGAQVH